MKGSRSRTDRAAGLPREIPGKVEPDQNIQPSTLLQVNTGSARQCRVDAKDALHALDGRRWIEDPEGGGSCRINQL